MNDFYKPAWEIQKKPHETNYQRGLVVHDTEMNEYENILWFYITPDSAEEAYHHEVTGSFIKRDPKIAEHVRTMNYVAVESSVDHKYAELKDYDKFKATLSLMPYEDFYESTWEETTDQMTFQFINEYDVVLFETTIHPTATPKEIEFDLNNSESLTVVAITNLVDSINGGLLDPVLVKE